MNDEFTNVFTVEQSIPFPSYSRDARNVMQWLNIQYTGKPLIPFTEQCSKEHQDAGYKLHNVRRVRLTFKIDKTGKWKLIDAALA